MSLSRRKTTKAIKSTMEKSISRRMMFSLFSSSAFFRSSPSRIPVLGKIAHDSSGKQLVSFTYTMFPTIDAAISFVIYALVSGVSRVFRVSPRRLNRIRPGVCIFHFLKYEWTTKNIPAK